MYVRRMTGFIYYIMFINMSIIQEPRELMIFNSDLYSQNT